MRSINQHSKYGYKVGYRENGSRLFVCRFKDRTCREAKESLRYYMTYTVLPNTVWEILPITLSEYKSGIWRDCPF
ncbi:MAG: hypothetical protein EOM87_10385 [Clostridia bacterium]|nr:hypothetical protein [Clostridia bacterium]